MVGVKHDRATKRKRALKWGKGYSHAVRRGNGPDVVGSSCGTGNRGLLVLVRQTFATEECSTSLRDLEDDGRFDVSSGFQDGIDDRRGGNILPGSARPDQPNGERLTMA